MDDLETNLDTATALGIQTVRVAAEGVVSDHPVIKSLTELPHFLSNNGYKHVEELLS